MGEKFSPREIESQAREIAHKSTEARGVEAGVIAPEAKPNAVSDPEVAAITAEWDRAEIKKLEQKLGSNESDEATRFREGGIEEIKSTTSDAEASQRIPNAAEEVVLGREHDSSNPDDTTRLKKAKSLFSRWLSRE
jgi:hypothetical protein